jgi:hypothetical protein
LGYKPSSLRGAFAVTAWGRLDQTNAPSKTTMGPDHAFWNSIVTNQPVASGCYKVCVDSLAGFDSPALSPSAPVNYSVQVIVQGNYQYFNGQLTASTLPASSSCIPTGTNPSGNTNKHGILAGIFQYPYNPLGLSSDPKNCGFCGVVCGEFQDCVQGVCKTNNIMMDPLNCGTIGNVCQSSTVCRGGVCIPDGDLRITVTWDRLGDLDLYVFPPVAGTKICDPEIGADVYSAWGRMDPVSAQNSPYDLGPESVYWNSSRIIAGSTHPTPSGTYVVCLLTTSFNPSVSSQAPVNFALEIANSTYKRTIVSNLTLDNTDPQLTDPRCLPLGTSPANNDFHQGTLVAQFNYPLI